MIISLFLGYWFDVQEGYGKVVGIGVAILFYLFTRDMIDDLINSISQKTAKEKKHENN